ncbi:MAG: aminoglycoside 6-adenylyltransferase [Eubacteriales bacterium]|nr:aminoglycoside 6-adenylyltransferase [Eubacteriales bacterium]
MRPEEQMMELLMQLAQDERVRAAFLNGSRSHAEGPRDIFQDYDIVYVVGDTQPFVRDHSWLAPFGDIIVCQEPDLSALYDDGDVDRRYGFLVIFADGVRVDFSFQTVAYTLETCLVESGVILWDKDGILPPLPKENPAHLVRRPTAAEFRSCCNEFWWVSTYVAKGLWRGQLLFAIAHLEKGVRPMLLKLLEWQAGLRGDWAVTAGKCDKYLPQYLTAQEMDALARTYPALNAQDIWQALEAAAELFGEEARAFAARMGYPCEEDEAARTRAYLQRVKENRL